MVPDRGAGCGEQLTLLGVVPLRDNHGRPDGLPAGQHGTQCRQATPLQRGTPTLTLAARRLGPADIARRLGIGRPSVYRILGKKEAA